MLKSRLFAASLALILAAPLAAQAQTSLHRIVVFGTSLSDPGNAFALAGGTNTAPDYDNDPFLVPNTPYARGGHHFSNGATWVEQLAKPRGLAAYAQAALRSDGAKGANYAVGGARARDAAGSFNFSDQLEAFMRDHGNVAPADPLYVVEMGGNDIRDAMVAFVAAGGGINGQLAAGAVIQDAVTAMGIHLFTLHGAGARKFLVWKIPNVGLTPAIRSLGPDAAGLADALSRGFNDAVEANVLASLEGLPDVQLFRLNVYDKIQSVVGQPSEFGLSNVHAPCITPRSAPYHCQNFDGYLFWDGIHPTKAAHAIIAHEAAAALPH